MTGPFQFNTTKAWEIVGNKIKSTYNTYILFDASNNILFNNNVSNDVSNVVIDPSGNITALSFIGDGSQLSGIAGANLTNYSDASFGNVDISGSINGTLASAAQPNITSIASRLGFDTSSNGYNRVIIDNSSALWIKNSHANSSDVTHFNYMGADKVNYIRGTTQFTEAAFFSDYIHGTLTWGTQPYITNVGSRLGFDTQSNGYNRVIIDNSSALWIKNSHTSSIDYTVFNYMGAQRVNYINGTTSFNKDAYFAGSINGTLGGRIDLSQTNRVLINNSTEFWIVNSHSLSNGAVTHFNYVGQTRVNYIRGTTEFSQTAYFPAGTPSDDRLKHNEQIITNGLSVLSQLTPKKYDKSQVLMAADYIGDISGEYTVESGLIAQDLLETDISFVVKIPDDLEIDPYGVDYNSVFTYAIAGIKELHAIVTTQAATISLQEATISLQAATISTLEERLTALEARLTALENK